VAAAKLKICSPLQFVIEKPFRAFSYHSAFHSERGFLKSMAEQRTEKQLKSRGRKEGF